MADSIPSENASDVVIIGGGLIGSSIALRLAQGGLRVRVIDRGSPASEASGAAAGMLAAQGEMTEPDEFFELCMASRALYPAFASEVESLSGESVGYRRDGSVMVAVNEKELEELNHIYRAQSQLGLPIEHWSGDDLRKRVPGLGMGVRGGSFVPGDHWLDNERLTRAVAKAAERAGARFSWGLTVTGFHLQNDRIETVAVADAPGKLPRMLAAGKFILAAGCWSGQLAATVGLRLPIEPCRGQMLEFEGPSDLPLVVRCGMHYLVPRRGSRVLIGTTAEYVGYEKEVTGEGFSSILEGVGRFAPMVRSLRFRRAWAGLRPDTPDHLPVLGQAGPKNLIFATGHFRNGILLAPITSQVIAELVLKGKPSRPLDAYQPGRFAR